MAKQTSQSLAATAVSRQATTLATAAREHAVLGWLAVSLLFRAYVVVRYRIDSDEPQHLHVAWGWAHGLVAYRDFFDNHLPLFHLLAAPFLAGAAESSSILLAARLLVVPLAAAMLVVSWSIARALFDRATAWWCLIAVSLFPLSLLKSVEFRNDNLCVVFCLLAMLVVLAPLTPRRMFLAGLLLGAGFTASLKTGLFAAALFIAITATFLLRRDPRLRNPRELLRLTLAAAAGFAIPVAIMVAVFAALGCLPQLVFDTFGFNRLFPANPLRSFAGAVLYLPVVALVHIVARHLHRASRTQLLTGLVATHFIVLTLGFWPLITMRDFLPVYPLLMILLAGTVPRGVRYALPLVLLVLAIRDGDLLQPPDRFLARQLDETTRLTTPADRIIDLKGETLFRRRGTYFIFERVGNAVFTHGLLPETTPEDAVRNRAYVASRDSYLFPPRTRRFLNQHYVSVGLMRVAGARPRDGAFTIAIAGPYAADAPVDVDGKPFAPGTWLDAGAHRVTRGSAQTIVWAPAIERGFLPVSAAVSSPPQ